jgi:hypothetical protein
LNIKQQATRMELKRISTDTSKSVFTRYGIDQQDRPALGRDLSRRAMQRFVAKSRRQRLLWKLAAGRTLVDGG